ncbi:hypothetical protein HUO13_32180 [Saccharopolyspora erythraea]|uniref:hypothetical protein n=1 Tax=Saccharopolyspora erythraea TaxID=1836 RepID=UPI001BA5EDF5|nr:hypothetical protein [Saccharopolyspora erythraea]QUH04819.1 hypothetical protein HUO13_32180 [Saccharopolyspora erythraea]
MRAPRWLVLKAVPILAACATLLGCGAQEVQRPSQSDTLRAYQPRFDEVRRKLVQVESLLPAGRAGEDSCDAKPPLSPMLNYQGGSVGTNDRAGNNTEVVMEPALQAPDTVLVDNVDVFAYDGATELVQSLRWTGPHGPLGEDRFTLNPPAPQWEERHDRELRATLEQGLSTQYLVVLRVAEYSPPESGDGRTKPLGYSGRVVLDGFVVDLRQLKLLCRFTAGDEYSGLAVINIRPGQGWASRIYEELQQGAGYEIAGKLGALTGGTAEPPQQ